FMRYFRLSLLFVVFSLFVSCCYTVQMVAMYSTLTLTLYYEGTSPEVGVPDMTVISDIDELGINKNLMVRYGRDQIYRLYDLSSVVFWAKWQKNNSE
ncbi:hypothetical protein L9F63_012312, partial [Diploptera punctata]